MIAAHRGWPLWMMDVSLVSLQSETFREIAEKKPLLDKMGLCEWILEFKPHHKLAGYLHMRSGGMTVPKVSALETHFGAGQLLF